MQEPSVDFLDAGPTRRTQLRATRAQWRNAMRYFRGKGVRGKELYEKMQRMISAK